MVPSSSSAPAPKLAPAERRRLIEQAATELFARDGYSATTVDDIVTAAGLTKPMLYRHFESKQELCISLLERHREELVAAPLARFRPDELDATDRRGQIPGMIGAWLDHAKDHPDAIRLLFLPIRGDAEVERVQRELHARQRATMVALLREFGQLDDQEAEPMGEVVRSSLAAVALWWIEHPDAERDVLVQVLLRMVHGLIGVAEIHSKGSEAR